MLISPYATSNRMMPNPKNNNADSKNNNSASKDFKSASRNNSDSKTKPDSKRSSDSKTSVDAPPQGESGGGDLPPPPGAAQPLDSQQPRNGKVYKSGPLFLSSKGIGWTSWKKRWFILTQTSLVFFRSDPNAIQKGNEANLTLGGIDLNSSGSVVVKADKKLLTVLFPDGRDGRAFTLKAETSEDLNEWKVALEEALANAPTAGTGIGQNGILKNEKGDTADGSQEQPKEQTLAKSMVLGRPILLALEDIDGTPSFLEKALRYIEEHGVKVEGILRQAADVDDVERRIRDYEQGKMDFSSEDDPHVIGDCIKYVLRELPSSPVPASCCNALLKAFRTDRATRVGAMRAAICDTFPEPNRCLLQRILIMMETVAENKAVNRMSISAVAACMAPLLLRPLLNGECDLGSEFSMSGDGSVQLLQAAAAANHAQAIIITLLEEYDKIFGEGDMLSDYSDSDDYATESEELSDDETYEEDEEEDGEYTSEVSHPDEDSEHASSVAGSETGNDEDSSQHHSMSSGSVSSVSVSHEDLEASEKSPFKHDNLDVSDNVSNQSNDHSIKQTFEHVNHSKDDSVQSNKSREVTDHIKRNSTISNGPVHESRRATFWGRSSGRRNLSMENLDLITAEEAEILRLEALKAELEEKVEAEARENAILKVQLMNKRNALEERHLALEQDVAILQEQLNKERELRKALEVGLTMSQTDFHLPASIDEKIKADLEDIALTQAEVISLQQKADDLEIQLNQEREQNESFGRDSPQNQGKSKKDREARKSKDSRSGKELPPNQQSDSAHYSKSEPSMSKSSSTNAKRSNSKGETASTSSALSKLTNRLKILKEKRNQIANELQTIDKERNKSQNKGSRKGSDDESANQLSEKGKGLDSQNYRGGSLESSFQNIESLNKLDKQSTNHPNLDRGKSETILMEKPHNVVHPRTYSR